ncbi:PP2C family protein-serine/threonine phosphatase [Actinacidiphila sp. DG2A-62]|uniref:PP2C family protein-serine/threonine phosphatase n=1 Tax=Actinacidiphila sp. DG2A-62 TaxID=3108821 RepID=UPI002DBCA8CC|nr:PP2C family protein-serine/threonine phosphatase [Actinacidiphila sp. DG2A-62]MEC3998245.1 PP2C family protein-serine/threonine phosphatase [Actinacidiphila sp. DG2A-62]
MPRSPYARLAAPLVLVAVLLAVDLIGGSELRIGGLMVAVPALAAVFLDPSAVLVVALVTVACILVTGSDNDQMWSANFVVILATVVLISAGAVAAAGARQRRERQLAKVRRVAAVIQRVLLRPLPERLGPLTIASMYLAAEEEAAIGGDLYAAARLPGGDTRLIIGDVQGKGLGAVEVAGLLISAFRRAGRRGVPLPELPGWLDAGLREDLAELVIARDPDAACAPDPVRDPAGVGDPAGVRDPAFAAGSTARPDRPAGPDCPAGTDRPTGAHLDPGAADDPAAARRGPSALEGFVTAAVVDVHDGGRVLQVANCGHPPPLLIRRRAVRTLDATVPGLPLGLGDLGPRSAGQVDSFALDPGDIVLLYTDGVIETRDAAGAFYPLADRLPELGARAGGLDDLLVAVRDDLQRHAAGRLGDDIAMVAFRRAG